MPRPRTFQYIIASLAAKGPSNLATTSGANGYPFWYQDANGVKLDLCLDPQDQKCLVPFEMPDPSATRVSFPDNFPGESFWWAGEAAFANEDPVDGDQMSFGRIRIDGLQLGQEYKVTHPYGTKTFIAEDDGDGGGEIDVTEDLGCFPGPTTKCDFDEARFRHVGPFLTWKSFGPGGVDGDPNTNDPDGRLALLYASPRLSPP